jgi:hypothetical protein
LSGSVSIHYSATPELWINPAEMQAEKVVALETPGTDVVIGRDRGQYNWCPMRCGSRVASVVYMVVGFMRDV